MTDSRGDDLGEYINDRLEAARKLGRQRRREELIDFGTWISEQAEIDAFTVDEVVDRYLEESK